MSSKRSNPRPSFFAPKELPIPYTQAYPAPQAPFQAAPGIPSQLDVRVSIMHDPDATVATAELNATGQPYATPLLKTTGSSKRTPGDEPDDPEVAVQYAVARALRKMAAKIEKDAAGKVRHADSNRAHKAASKPPKRPKPTVITTVNQISIVSTRSGGVEAHLPPGYNEDTIPKVVRDTLEKMHGPGITYVCEPGSEPYAGKHAAPTPAEGFPRLEDLPLYPDLNDAEAGDQGDDGHRAF